MGFVYVWEYRVRPDAVAAFEAAYGPTGDWVRLFQRYDGYGSTELLRDRTDPLRYLSVDHWQSKDHYDAFRTASREAFDALDRRCADLTTREEHLGDFESPETAP